MENQQKKIIPEQDKDVDLGNVLSVLSRAFAKLGRFIGRFFTSLATAFIDLLIFLKKRIIWLVLAVVLGYAYGLYLNHSQGNKYYSTMTARLNFESSRALYNTSNYLNSLINEGQYKELSQLLSISEKEASRLVSFEAEPVENELVLSDLYKEYFFENNRSSKLRTDTFWTKTITYKDFKNKLTKYDIPIQEITVISTQANIFPKLQQGFVNTVISNGILKKNQALNQRMRAEEEQIIVSSLQGLDTLRTVYNQRLRARGTAGEAGNNLTVLDQAQINQDPELQLYDKVLELKDELKTVRKSLIENQEIFQIYASFNPVGQQVNIFKQNAIKNAYKALAIALLILMLIEVFKALNEYEKKRNLSN